ncbi:DEAD/DEAH box helicase family protein [Tenacibaculum maritimum]|nr:DEAD/DEAH box helicase family protein [Tenacibaculum maritimum]MDB0610789.1 DEAD/DEAH box helicase family protein [Tenacibaculum maritimum]
MNIDNSLFENTPIEFKEINPEDFDSKLYNVKPKIVIEPNDDGYISDELLPILTADLDNKNTTIINAGVGQGKTRAIIEVLTKYANNPDYLIVIAVPYKSLIEQYVIDCSKHIPKKQIFNLIGQEDELKKSKKRKGWGFTSDETMLPISSKVRGTKVHIMTINALLGNPGDDNLFVSKMRSEYFKYLNEFCQSTNKKMIWLFDEIHDSIHNFKEQFIYNLWSFHGLVHKAYIVSATFNEASKEVIKYVSEFTDKSIFIIESERTPKPEKQSNLHLNFYIDHQLYKDANLVSLISSLVKNNKPFDILVYSKSLAEKLINPNKTSPSKVKKVSDVLKPRILEINRCFSEVFNPKANKKYNKTKINIGTNFSTGINIECLEHTLIILFPKDLSVDYINNKGVFTNGSNVIIQALARQRKKGDIHVFLPNPDGIDLKSLPHTETQNNKMYECFKTYKRGNNKEAKYSDVNSLDNLLSTAYDKLIYDTSNANKKLKDTNRTGLNRLAYPTKEIFILNQGEKYITKEFFGGNLSAYILWASLSNQFLNCKLKSIKNATRLDFDKENLLNDVRDFFNAETETLNNVLEEFNLFDSLSEYEKFEFINTLILNSKIYIDGVKASSYQKYKVHLIMLKTLYFDSYEFTLKDAKSDLFDYYLRSCVFHSSELKEVKKNLNTRDLTCIEIFKKWYQFIELIDNSLEENKGLMRILAEPNSEFIYKFTSLGFDKDLAYIFDNHYIFSTELFQLKDTYNKALKKNDTKNQNRHIETFYKTCIKTFYNFKVQDTTKNKFKTSYYIVEKIISSGMPNLIYKPLPEYIL